MDADNLQEIVELCDTALSVLRHHDSTPNAKEPYPTTALNNIATVLLDKNSLTQDVRSIIAISDQGRLTTLAKQLCIYSWQPGHAYSQFSGSVLEVRQILQANIERLNAKRQIIPHVIFYSWQSDHPNNTNRGLIEKALQDAIKKVAADGEIFPRLDQGAQGTAGSQSLHATILKKIEECGVFVADVSLVDKVGGHCNSNVLYELGYATRALGEDRVLLVCNTAHGAIEKLPFDIKHKFVIGYRAEGDEDKTQERKRLASAIEEKIRPIFQNNLKG